MRIAHPFYAQLAADSMVGIGPFFVVLMFLEVRKNIVIRPPSVASCVPGIVVLGLPARVDHSVHGARSPYDASAGAGDPPCAHGAGPIHLMKPVGAPAREQSDHAAWYSRQDPVQPRSV